MEQIIFYILTFLMGSVFGSFFTLAVYRIPLKQDITHKRSYCPKCNHKLSFFDMIPILSYIFLGGKCRYCKEKIRVRYILLEIFTGFIFLLFAMSLNIAFYPMQISKVIYFIFAILYLSGIIIIAGIEKETHSIQKGVMIYEIIVIGLYMVYLYIVEKTNIYRYAIYLLLLCIFLIKENKLWKKKLERIYPLEILELSIVLVIFSGEIIYFLTVIGTLLLIAINQIIEKLKYNKQKAVKKESIHNKNIPIGFYLICSNIFWLILINFLACKY